MNNTKMMRAAVQEKIGVLKIKEVPVPTISPKDVLIKIKYSGICGTDISIFSGKYSADFLPMIPGHEFSGVVEKIGNEVTNIKIGDRVTADINMSCGTCFYCRRGIKLMCHDFHQLGIHYDGSFSEYVKVPANQVHIIPDKLSFLQGAFVEPVSCVIHSANAMNLKLGSNVAIIGGGLGIIHGLINKYRGASPVILIEPNEHRLQVAKKMGIDILINPNNCDPVDEVKKITDGRGADYVIEAVGKKETYAQAIAMSRPGGTIAAFGIANGEDTIKIKPYDFVLGERTMVGSCAGVGRDWVDAITLIEGGIIKPDPMFSMLVPLEEIELAIQELQSNHDLLKIFVSMEHVKREIL
jgi:2-desacetyl-2-hydroxyethyl bacteriochlorophyllide A dehydrogenase